MLFVATTRVESHPADYIRLDSIEYYTHLTVFLRFCILILYDCSIFLKVQSYLCVLYLLKINRFTE